MRTDVERYAHFLEELYSRIGDPPGRPRRRRSELLQELPGADALLDTFSTAFHEKRSAQGEREQEWNPLSQRIYLPEPPPRKSPPGSAASFERVDRLSRQLIVVLHEAMHLLLWEPFFTGAFRPKTAAQFRDLCLAFEGTCFWYADILATPLFRAKAPDGEFVLSRAAVSQPNFHPYRAFRALGLRSADRIREIYVSGFRGHYDRKLVKGGDAYTRNLAVRIYGFYLSTRDSDPALYRLLDSLGFWDEYRDRFCRIGGLPALFHAPAALLNTDVAKYCEQVTCRGLPGLKNLSLEGRAQVRLRRALQSRAYFAMNLRHVLASGNYFCGRGRLEPSQPLAEIRNYLDEIEQLLRRLADRTSVEKIGVSLGFLDRRFGTRVRQPLMRSDAWVASRFFLFPRLKTWEGKLGLEMGSPKDFEVAAHRVIHRYLSVVLEGRELRGRALAPLLRWSEELVESSSYSKRKRALRQLLGHPKLRHLWSVPLASMDPERKSFSELLFFYQ